MGNSRLLYECRIERDQEGTVCLCSGKEVDGFQHGNLMIRKAAIKVIDAHNQAAVLLIHKRQVLVYQIPKTLSHHSDRIRIDRCLIPTRLKQLVQEIVN